MSNKRVFFALWPDHNQRERLRDIINSVARTVEGKAVDRRDWHVTLVYVGELPEEQLPDLMERASQIQVEHFHLSFDRLEFWARPRIACLIAPTVPAELQSLIDTLRGIVLDFGVMPEDRTYRPHITVVKNARTFNTERLAQRATTEWSGFELVESISGHGGVTYRPMKK